MKKKNPNGFGSFRKKTVNGRTYHEYRYTDPVTHKRKSISASTEAECRRKAREIQASITRGDFVTPKKMTLAEWLKDWLHTRENITDGTRLLYQSTIDLYIVPHLGHIQLQDLRWLHCQTFVNALAHDPNRAKQLSPKTIHNIIGTLSKALTTAVQAQIIPTNPAAGLDLPRVSKTKPKVMETDEQTRFMEAIRLSPYRSVFMIGLFTGMRVSEILGLSWKDINFKTGEINVNKQLKRQRGHGTERTLSDTKTHTERGLIAPPFLLDVLRKTSIQQKEWKLRAGELWANNANLVFTREDGSPLPHTTVSNAFKRIAKEIGRPELSFHSLRHTFITDMIRSGVDLKTVSDLAGHSTITITADTYALATSEMKQAAAQRTQEAYEQKKA